MPIEVRVVTDPQELQAVYRQRYEIWVEEYNCQVAEADVCNRTFVDSLDESGIIFGAFIAGRLVGSVRVNYGDATNLTDGGFGQYFDVYEMHRFGPYFPENISIITKMVIDPAYRAGTLMGRLALATYHHAINNKTTIMFGLIDCMLSTKEYFLRLGYRQTLPEYLSPVIREIVVPGAFVIYDLENFKQVNSPLAKACPYHDEFSANWFRTNFMQELDDGFAKLNIENKQLDFNQYSLQILNSTN